MIDTGIAADAARFATDAQIALFRDMVDTGYKLVDDPIGFRVMDAEFHELVGVASRNDFLDRVSRSLYSLAIDQRRQASAQPGVLLRSAADHAAIVEAIAAHDPTAAAAAMAAHVANIRRTTFAVMEQAAPKT